MIAFSPPTHPLQEFHGVAEDASHFGKVVCVIDDKNVQRVAWLVRFFLQQVLPLFRN
jgi:hypothetical protein